ncbi:hypothetical protein DPMN_122931 [Dreissena polymorpha]|uniref:Uncharacterized protein n=1 Tax=Dreissena polymorpha TaxID=45954 RepID=A0A9D4GTH9_DREPO|nr:hypothetical protein DPMN_122931 [Dreissena polymorpha]
MHLTHTGIQNSLSRHFSCDNCSTDYRSSNKTPTTTTQSTTTKDHPKQIRLPHCRLSLYQPLQDIPQIQHLPGSYLGA